MWVYWLSYNLTCQYRGTMGHIMEDSLVCTFMGVLLKLYDGTREWAQL